MTIFPCQTANRKLIPEAGMKHVIDERVYIYAHRFSRIFRTQNTCRVFFCVVISTFVVATGAHANGLGESRPWQFETPHEKSAKANVVDVIERKKGGFYDGFRTVVYNTTNIGSQINCSNGASTNANIADNQQAGAAPTSAPQNTSAATSLGSSNSIEPSGSGVSAGTDTVNNDQANSGALNAYVDDTKVSSSLSGVDIGKTDQDLNNSQSNSGTLSSQVSDSVACAMDGATLTGSVESYVDGVPYGPLN